MRYVRPFDPHVHLRGAEYADEDYLRLAFEDAQTVGLSGFLEMPNPLPWLTTAAAVDKRHQTIAYRFQYAGEMFHGINIGLTNDINQVQDALALVSNRFRNLRADKIFYTHSTGDMGILDEKYQRDLWFLKTVVGYKGVSIGHFEDEKAYVGSFDPANPPSHSTYQCPEAEVVQLERQLQNAKDAEFKGTFYIAHCSNPESIKLVEKVRKSYLPFKIVIEVTWHHMFLNVEDDYPIHGNRVKMNPPLRPKKMQEELLEMVLKGKVDLIGTDHAPHPLSKKDHKEKPASGIPGILFWPRGVELLQKKLYGVSPEVIEKLTFRNACEIFDLTLLSMAYSTVVYQPEKWERYGYNPFSRLDKEP